MNIFWDEETRNNTTIWALRINNKIFASDIEGVNYFLIIKVGKKGLYKTDYSHDGNFVINKYKTLQEAKDKIINEYNYCLSSPYNCHGIIIE